MHSFLGYSWAEIASILAIISVLFSGLYWLVNHGGKVFNENIYSVLQPFSEQLKTLNNNIRKLNDSFDRQQANFEKLKERVDEHDRRLDRHHERIKSLFEKGEKE